MKGVSFLIICMLLLFPLIFLTQPSDISYLLGLSALVLMWVMGMIDAYINDELFLGREQWLAWQRVLTILPVLVISTTMVVLLVLWTQDLPVNNKPLVADTDPRINPDIHNTDSNSQKTAEIEVDMETDSPSESSNFFSIQVAAFSDVEGAEVTRRDLASKGYTVRIGQSVSGDGIWYRVLVGQFSNEQDAIAFMEKLRQREGLSDMLVRRLGSSSPD